MALRSRLHALAEWLSEYRDFWHPQPFHEPRPAWCGRWPRLAQDVLALSDAHVTALNDDSQAARHLLSRYCPGISSVEAWLDLPLSVAASPRPDAARWDWGIPGRKRSQIEAFVAAVPATGRPGFEWCAGKGHLGRLWALRQRVPVLSLERDAQLCGEGVELARRAGVAQEFLAADAHMTPVPEGCHALALHACGELHRTLLRQASRCAALDVVPCCYYHGVETAYVPMSKTAGLQLTREDVRLAVTETVTASRRQTIQRDRHMAWKLAFDALRRQQGASRYVPFKPVPPMWLRGDLASFCRQMAQREGLVLSNAIQWPALECLGWQRQREVMRLSLVRHAFRRPLELWMVLDMAVFLEERGWRVDLKAFCPRSLTPRNLLISARSA